MLRFLLIIILAILISVGFIWLKENEGLIELNWLDYHIEIDTTFFIIAFIIFLTIFIFIFQLLKNIFFFPRRMRKRLEIQKEHKALQSVVDGFVAMLSGDVKQTMKLANKAYYNKEVRPLSLLLLAQSAQSKNNTSLARKYFNEMLQDSRTKPIALKALAGIEKNDGNLMKAIEFTEESSRNNIAKIDGTINLQDLYVKTKQWDKLEENSKKLLAQKLIDKKQFTRVIATIYIVKSQEEIMRNLDIAIRYAKIAYKKNTNFVPAIINYVSCLAHDDKYSKAIKIIEKTYKYNPHPDLIFQYHNLLSSTPNERKIFSFNINREKNDIDLEKIEKLYNSAAKNYECLLAVATISKDLCNFDMTYKYLRLAQNIKETEDLYQMMAEIELHYHNEEGYKNCLAKAKEVKEDSKWRCSKCYYSSSDWHAFCNNCSAFDSMEYV